MQRICFSTPVTIITSNFGIGMAALTAAIDRQLAASPPAPKTATPPPVKSASPKRLAGVNLNRVVSQLIRHDVPPPAAPPPPTPKKLVHETGVRVFNAGNVLRILSA